MIRPQAGDVWINACGNTMNVVHVHNGVVINFWHDEDRIGEIDVGCDLISEFTKEATLIERDGRPYVAPREFKEGAYYLVIMEGEDTMAYYNNRGTFRVIGDKEDWGESAFTWIGEEVKVVRPNET